MAREELDGIAMRIGTLIAGLAGSVVVGVVFWLALFGFVQLNRPVPALVGPGVAVAPVPGLPGGPPRPRSRST